MKYSEDFRGRTQAPKPPCEKVFFPWVLSFFFFFLPGTGCREGEDGGPATGGMSLMESDGKFQIELAVG